MNLLEFGLNQCSSHTRSTGEWIYERRKSSNQRATEKTQRMAVQPYSERAHMFSMWPQRMDGGQRSGDYHKACWKQLIIGWKYLPNGDADMQKLRQYFIFQCRIDGCDGSRGGNRCRPLKSAHQALTSWIPKAAALSILCIRGAA